MNKYESVIIVKNNFSNEKLKEIISKVEKKIGEYAKITEKKDCGIKKLAYEIQNNKEGYYYLFQFEIEDNKETEAIKEIERFYRITDEILRYITIKK